ncbi:MAG TPA: hypothetical protein VK507_14235, partial [Iamia sp.]|nr:hypothetical protein [Iamia sp.]
ADGSTVAFDATTGSTGATDVVVVRDLATGFNTVIAAGNGSSRMPRLTGDGRWVTFTSAASDLVAGDDNGQADVFLHDRSTGTTTRITDGDGPSGAPWISANGATIAFTSTATDLVEGDTGDDGPARDVFVWSRASGAIRRASDGTADAAAPSVSGDGRIVAFAAGATSTGYGTPTVWDRSTGDLTPLPGPASVGSVQVSSDGGDVVGVTRAEFVHTYLRWPLRHVERLTFEPNPLPDAVRHEPYNVETGVSGGLGATLAQFQLPDGFDLLGTFITGTPEQRPGPARATFVLADDTGRRSLRRATIEIRAQGTVAYVSTQDASAHPVSVTPDGGTVAYTRIPTFNTREVWRRGPDGTEALVASGEQPSISADGTRIALLTKAPLTAGDVADTTDAYVVGPGGTTPLARGTGGGAVAVALSGDGTKAVVATAADDVVPGQQGPGTYLVDVASGGATRLTTDAVGPVAISDDGTVVAATEPHPQGYRQVVRFEGATRTVIDDQAPFEVPTLDVSADGDHVVYAKSSRGGTAGSSLLLWSQGAGPSIVLDDGIEVRHASVSADGSVVMYVGGAGPNGSSGVGDLFRWERSTGEVDWAVARREGGAGAATVDLTADGATAFFLTDQDLLDEAGGNEGWLLHTWTAP